MNVKRGLIAALVGAIAGMALTVVLMQVFQLYREHFGFDEYVPPMIACSSFLAGTAFATYTPKEKQSFAWTLVLIAIASFFLSAVLIFTFAPPRQRFKSDPPIHEDYAPLAILALSPVLPAAWLARRRMRKPASVL